jgi:hypothetical protein
MKHLDLFPKINIGDLLKLQNEVSSQTYPVITPSKIFDSFESFDSFFEYDRVIHGVGFYKRFKKDEVIFIADLKQETYYVKGTDYYYPFLFARVIDSGGERVWIQIEQHKNFSYMFSICK